MKAIETVYNGYRFRSRLEARWAVFFDTLGVKYEYEKEGYDLDGLWYLPDFWLPEQGCWAEIKGQEPTEEEQEKCVRMQAHSGLKVHLFFGEIPSIDCPGTVYTYRANPDLGVHPDEPLCMRSDYYGWCECPFCRKIEIIDYRNIECMSCNCFEKYFKVDEMMDAFHQLYPDGLPDYIYKRLFEWGDTPRIDAAYTAARQARFEHAERSQTAYRQGYLGHGSKSD
jgi:hypothetical protein